MSTEDGNPGRFSDAINKTFPSIWINRENTATKYEKIDFNDVEFYDEKILANVEKHLSEKIEDSEHRKSEMTYKERAFLHGIIRKTKPMTVVELGVSAGGSACVILNAMRDIDGAKLYSFDYSSVWYRDAGKADGRKTGFLVDQIVPELKHKWELYTGGVPCKYLDEHLPDGGIDVCLLDTAHSNPGEHLNILEILPFMKQNGIVIYHDTAYHCTDMRRAHCTTCCVSINSLNGKRIHLGSEKMAGLPNIGAIILDKNFENMLIALFSNLSLPWAYRITDYDFIEMFAHFSKYYSRDLLQIYLYYYVFYTNGGLNNVENAMAIAEKQTVWSLPKLNERSANSRKELAMAILGHMYRLNENTERAIELLKRALDGNVLWARYDLFDVLWKRNNPGDASYMLQLVEPFALEEDVLSMARLGRMYMEGRGVKKNTEKAVELLKKAVEGNVSWAKTFLDEIRDGKGQ